MCLLASVVPMKVVDWIQECITKPRYSISLNGSSVGYFKGGKGLRQGDPLSSYLFPMEDFTRFLK